ncbi:30S ribosomal protein S20 [Desulfitobacterium sp.]|uniref:30S ribosomal protein S20 n=1 Tax=Desulfitobacterium sp. TaxID=49981 RepID=UPI002B20E256|nr:30S ribosomal protein S20 [Desulfitobacterium sp.]MEA4902299.1 30S ribosomal protein S20 [Desulfitobacterium sp.]
MPNIKSAIKRVELTKARALKNAAAKSTLRTTLRRFDESLSTDAETAKVALSKATRALDKATTKGLVHKNTAARKKSRLCKRYAQQFAQVG